VGTHISHSAAETTALGEAWGCTAANGLVIGLVGDLGAGKTQLVRGLATGLGTTARVHSPTFALVNVYSGGRLILYHLDLYRLDGPRDIVGAGMQEYLAPAGVTVIEWVNKWFAKPAAERAPLEAAEAARLTELPVPSNGLFRWVELEVLSETERRIVWEDFAA